MMRRWRSQADFAIRADPVAAANCAALGGNCTSRLRLGRSPGTEYARHPKSLLEFEDNWEVFEQEF
jgi:hypothetical protein